MEVALTWHDRLFRQQAPGASRCYFAVVLAEAPIKPGLSDYLVLLPPFPYKFL